jgi:LPPG:FO 2-phospho-L-lactate transferase
MAETPIARQDGTSTATAGDPSAAWPRRVTVLAGGIGGSRFLRGLLAALGPTGEVTVIGNTADDMRLYGLHVSPDLDTVMYTLGGGIDEEQGWGRSDESFLALEEIRNVASSHGEVGALETWFGLGDRDLGTHLTRTAMLEAGATLSEVTEVLCRRWQPGVRLLPMTDDDVQTHIVIEDPAAPDGTRRMHFQEYWVRLHAEAPAAAVDIAGAAQARPAPGVLDAITTADLVVFPPSNPVVSIGAILAVPGIAEAVRATAAPVVGISPVISGAPVRGMADKLLPAVGVDTSAAGIGLHYGARSAGGLLDAFLVDSADADAVGRLTEAGLRCVAVPLWMSDVDATAAIARSAVRLVDPTVGS